ncbi:gamma-aminobutyric acid receptor subunit delta [Eurytemora carolleeae]|uniref:gamma-aminobutyric acid receptor subunit delta n=1 Tax=Eurytemora carolleeae TaxID=1294199 RepID=UPI000C793BA1|nr:gamma-aminobutyric acid receptor subunit delta [Eurytemora carolleeae]|eukprot:XP_023322339.1 gamma-aminobutyric acid receptor subunit delta-like [Eurytemora affinis]
MPVLVGLISWFLIQQALGATSSSSLKGATPRILTAPEAKPSITNRSICTGSYCLPPGYSSLDPPTLSPQPLQIKIELDQIRIIEFDDKLFTVSFSLFLAVHWREWRLQGPPPSPTAPYQAIETQFIENLWVPDIYVYNMERINRVLTDHKGRLFVVNGQDIYFRQEVVVTLWCPARFDFYPLDKQECMFRIGSYQYSTSKLLFSVTSLEQDKTRPNTLLDYSKMDIISGADDLFVWKNIGNYSVAGFRLKIKRRVFKFLVNYYLPSGMFVLVSWASFLIPPDLIPGRMNLLVALFLVLINIFNSVTRQIPNSEVRSRISLETKLKG